MPRGSRDAERMEHFYRVMTAVEDKAEYDDETGYTLTMRDFRNAVTEALYIVGRRSINDWFNKCVDLGFIVKLGASGNLHYAKDAWRSSPICKAARTAALEIENVEEIPLINKGRSR
jgi:hypothetical protein